MEQDVIPLPDALPCLCGELPKIYEDCHYSSGWHATVLCDRCDQLDWGFGQEKQDGPLYVHLAVERWNEKVLAASSSPT